jgi:hypothetical protein
MEIKSPYFVREFEPERDYETVKAWWHGHGWPGVPLAMLPKLGVIAFRDEQEAAAGWLYMDNSCGVCMLEWLVTNPDLRGREPIYAIRTVTDYLTLAAKEMNYGVMLTSCKQPSLARIHEKAGFTRTDGEMIHLVKTL